MDDEYSFGQVIYVTPSGGYVYDSRRKKKIYFHVSQAKSVRITDGIVGLEEPPQGKRMTLPKMGEEIVFAPPIVGERTQAWALANKYRQMKDALL